MEIEQRRLSASVGEPFLDLGDGRLLVADQRETLPRRRQSALLMIFAMVWDFPVPGGPSTCRLQPWSES